MSDSQTRLIRKALGLLDSMIVSGEQHSPTSKKMIKLAYEAIDGIEKRLHDMGCGETYDHDLQLIYEHDGATTYECRRCGAEVIEEDDT